ncbi:ubiquitin hydrolase, putative [Bodo saltans]|uniref:ubiquitinyl hydrolase 1 n=1 Tax=Bodo saltans TaxID=75058 RepID=A0A0S4IJG5_BODSA|nr:ubiquitin hydrolase, putative [Bodo saltans]|eukprot:CUE85127.1 ubiquitin hydrolase, putative [Bodo saltans]
MTMMPPSLKNVCAQQPSQPVVSVSRTMLEPWRFSSGPPQSRRGLMNLGNTCYMNSTLQCLKQTELGNYVTSGVFAEFDDHNANSMIQAFAFVMRELEVKDLRSSVNPSQLKYQVGIKNDMFSGKSQQDASEFLRALLDGMHEEINAKRGQRATIGDIPNNIGEDHDIAAIYWKQYKQCNQSLIVNLFAFQERSSIICPNCGNNPRSFSPVLGIEVPIPTLNRAVCVEDCFAAYCKKEILDADSLYHCDSCKRKVSASKQLTFHTLPRTLVVTLKRFRSYGNFSDKVSSTVAFQECLEMRPFLSNNHWDGLTTYKLTGVINHQGNIHGGHYTADVKDMQDGLWRNFSDEVVRDASEPNFKLGYTLFYLLDERK